MRLFVTAAVVALMGTALGAQSPAGDQATAQTEEQMKRLLQEKQLAEHRFNEMQVVTLQRRMPLERPITGAPYSADLTVESNQTLADGNRINQKTTGRVYRDGEGRTRREEDRSDGLVSVSIFDPVAGVSYSLDPENKIAWKSPSEASEEIMKKLEDRRREARMKEEQQRRGAGGPGPESREAEVEAKRKREAEMEGARISTGRLERGMAAESHKEGPLERKSLEGIAVEGRRSTTTIRAGAIGNEMPITITSEEWASPDLKVLVLTRRVDPRSGESSYKLTNIVRAEPDRSLFQVPPDYTVKETGIRKLEESREREP